LNASRLAGIRSLDAPTPGPRTHVLSSESPGAPPVVFLHGNVSSARFLGRAPADRSPRWQALAVGLRFRQDRDKPVDATGGLGDFTDDLQAVLESGVVGPAGTAVHLVGRPMGGGSSVAVCP
jgi:pimeloyl-ACP methyl ester carboxylesterase